MKKLLFVSVLASFAFMANSVVISPAFAKPAPKEANTELDQDLIAIREALNKADHDYDGHRAAAVHQISHAIHLLQHGKADPKPGQHFVGGKHTEPQEKSDAQLKKALEELQSLTVPAGKHQAQVQTHIAKAITDLQTALKVK